MVLLEDPEEPRNAPCDVNAAGSLKQMSEKPMHRENLYSPPAKSLNMREQIAARKLGLLDYEI